MSDEEEILALEETLLSQNNNITSSSLSDAFRTLKDSKFYAEAKQLPSGNETSASTSVETHKSATAGGPVLVNSRQRGNPLLQHVRRVAWQYEDGITADYVPSNTTGILFLSLRYHSLNPDYIHDRIKLLAQTYELRVLLVQVDCPDPHHALKSLTRICLLADLTLMLAWSAEEAGRVVETYKIFENKPPDMIMEKTDDDPYSKVVSALSSLRPVNKSDAVTLLTTFGTVGRVLQARLTDLELCPGLGPNKAAKLYSALHQPFLKATPNKSKSKSIAAVTDPCSSSQASGESSSAS